MTSIVRHLARRSKKGIVSSKLLKPGEPTMPRPRVIGKSGALWLAAVLALLGVFAGRAGRISAGTGSGRVEVSLDSDSRWERTFNLGRGEVREISVAVSLPSSLPPNGRVAVSWQLERRNGAEGAGTSGETAGSGRDGREPDAFGIYNRPTARWRKVLHALDPDVFVIYRAPVSGRYVLSLAPVIDEVPAFGGPRWRETGTAPQVAAFPRYTPWPSRTRVSLLARVRPLDLEGPPDLHFHVEQEPNDTPEQAQPIPLPEGEGVQRVLVTAGADDVEYFDNGRVGRSGDDWFRIEYSGTEPRLLTCNLTLPDHTLAARLRFYALPAASSQARPSPAEPSRDAAESAPWEMPLLPLVEYTRGRNDNERVHQQAEDHRSEINRLLQPGGVYFLRAEANAPGYEIELRLLQPAPYRDPRLAVRQGLYDHLAQVDSWLTNRPRGASVERRIRDTGNLLGTHCMSCHTQAGVWGSAVPVENGYRIENVQNFRRLVNVMYESLRPTNYLKEAANNTSLAPLDVGDGPAGTRVAGHNLCTAERVLPPRKLHSKQLLRAANQVLQTADPSGINAAGPGSNVGKSVVFSFAGEILRTAWDRTRHPRYFAAMEEKALKLLEVQPKYSDDLSHRIEFFRRFFPRDYLQVSGEARSIQQRLPPPPPRVEPEPAAGPTEEDPPPAEFPHYRLLSEPDARDLWQRVQRQVAEDEKRLRAVQNPDGSWGFDPGQPLPESSGWKTDGKSDPAPTALALIALEALGYGADEPAVDSGVQALLGMQKPYGLWNQSAKTGFVTTAYVLHALSRLFPLSPAEQSRQRFEFSPEDSLRTTLARVRDLSHSEDPELADLMVRAAAHDSPMVRYWGLMGLGGIHGRHGVDALIAAMGDPVKMVRDAAAWATEQTLLDDRGFEELFEAYETGNDRVRETVLKALGMRADAVLTRPGFDQPRLARLLARALTRDPHPGVRAWAAKAAWQWWVWNPPLRPAIQQAWLSKLTAPEAEALVEQCLRYQSHALFIANGHKANSSKIHQYPELSSLFRSLEARVDDPGLPPAGKDRLVRRLVQTAATFYNTSGGDGGPSQMGYVTPGAGEMMGKAVLHYWEAGQQGNDSQGIRLALEAAAGIPYADLQDRLMSYATEGPEELRTLAAAALADPSAVTLPATQELIQPMVEQIHRGALDYDRRKNLAEPVLKLLSRAGWTVPETQEQRQILYSLLVPSYQAPSDSESLREIRQAAEEAVQTESPLNPAWFIADRMGKMLAANPDFQTPFLARLFPDAVANPMEAHFWLPSIDWLSTFQDEVPVVRPASEGEESSGLPQDLLEARSRSRALLLQLLQIETPELSRRMAVNLSYRTRYRQDPAVLAALKVLVKSETNEEIKEAARNVLRSEPEVWMADLEEAVRNEPMAEQLGLRQAPSLPEEFLASFRFFQDHVAPEFNRPQRHDQMACMGCHGVPGRVPSMELARPDGTGYLSAPKMLKNYLILQARVDPENLEKSKLLRKPLNIQTGKEDGHQGGRRYTPSDRGYRILRHWALDLPGVQAGAGPPTRAVDGAGPATGVQATSNP